MYVSSGLSVGWKGFVLECGGCVGGAGATVAAVVFVWNPRVGTSGGSRGVFC